MLLCVIGCFLLHAKFVFLLLVGRSLFVRFCRKHERSEGTVRTSRSLRRNDLQSGDSWNKIINPLLYSACPQKRMRFTEVANFSSCYLRGSSVAFWHSESYIRPFSIPLRSDEESQPRSMPNAYLLSQCRIPESERQILYSIATSKYSTVPFQHEETIDKRHFGDI